MGLILDLLCHNDKNQSYHCFSTSYALYVSLTSYQSWYTHADRNELVIKHLQVAGVAH